MNQPAALRVATFNVENLSLASASAGHFTERIRLLRPQLVRLRADILCLQEVDGDREEGSGERSLRALDALLEGTAYEGFHRIHTRSRKTAKVRDRHNLVILSRVPPSAQRQVFHDLVAPPLFRAPTREGGEGADRIEWDRPLLYGAYDVAGGHRLHVLNVHLRAPRAAYVAKQKSASHVWTSMAGWAQGFFLAAVKRAGQAFEARLLIDELFDREPEALILVTGDFNADLHEIPVRTIRGDEEDAGNPLLAMRTLVPLDMSLPGSRRFSVVHHGRPQMLDHMLASRPLLAFSRGVDVHNEALGDELITPHAVRASLESFHAPMVAEFAFDPR